MEKIVLDSIKLELPEDFYTGTWDGFDVDIELAKLWAIELDMVRETVEILDKYNLTYFAMGGTLLGAVRHKGFIPWDDDIDLIMPRADYNKLLEIGPKEFKDPYFFQCVYTEKDFWRSHIQIRNSKTTGYIPRDLRRNNNKGIFIDIFVLDEVPENKKERNKHTKKLMKMDRMAKTAMDYRPYDFRVKPFSKCIRARLLKCFFGIVGYNKWFDKYQKRAQKYNGSGSKKIAHTTFFYHEGKCWNAKDFAESVKLPFHMIELNCPKGYKHVLECQYGPDYMTVPDRPPKAAHGGVIYHAEIPYTEYLA